MIWDARIGVLWVVGADVGRAGTAFADRLDTLYAGWDGDGKPRLLALCVVDVERDEVVRLVHVAEVDADGWRLVPETELDHGMVMASAQAHLEQGHVEDYWQYM